MIWSKDWENYSFSQINEKAEKIPKDLSTEKDYENYFGISKKEFIEYLLWTKENHPRIFTEWAIAIWLTDKGFPLKVAEKLSKIWIFFS